MFVSSLLMFVLINDATAQFTCNDVCAVNNTCCDSGIGFYTCCPFRNGTCCNDGVSCCPGGYTCTSTHTCTSERQDTKDIGRSAQLPVNKRRPLNKYGNSPATPEAFVKLLVSSAMKEDIIWNMATVLTRTERRKGVDKRKLQFFKPINTMRENTHKSMPKGKTEYQIGQIKHLNSPAVMKPKGDVPRKEIPRYFNNHLKVLRQPKGGNQTGSGYAYTELRSLPDVICGTAVCVSNYTCCNWDGGPGCCQYTNGVCCSGNYCCPPGYFCDHEDTMYLCRVPTNSALKDRRHKLYDLSSYHIIN